MDKPRKPPPLDEPTDPHEPFPPQPDQGAPEMVTATGRATGGSPTAAASRGRT